MAQSIKTMSGNIGAFSHHNPHLFSHEPEIASPECPKEHGDGSEEEDENWSCPSKASPTGILWCEVALEDSARERRQFAEEGGRLHDCRVEVSVWGTLQLRIMGKCSDRATAEAVANTVVVAAEGLFSRVVTGWRRGCVV